MLAFVTIVCCPLLLALGAMADLVSYKIPNWIPLALLALFIAAAILSGMTLAHFGQHFIVLAVALAAGMTLWSFRLIGGGDAKLLAAASIWMGPSHIFDYCLIFAAVGGVFTLALLIARSRPMPAFTARVPFLTHLLNPKSGLPYGVALGLGALIVLPATPLFKLALSS